MQAGHDVENRGPPKVHDCQIVASRLTISNSRRPLAGIDEWDGQRVLHNRPVMGCHKAPAKSCLFTCLKPQPGYCVGVQCLPGEREPQSRAADDLPLHRPRNQ
jgi:hypothetical protein